jgi:transposase
MYRPHLSDEIRDRALAAYGAGRPITDIARFCQNHPSTIYRWIRHRSAIASGRSRPRPGAAPRVPRAQRGTVAALVARLPDATIAQLCDAYAATHDLRIGQTTMRRYFAGLGITRKKDPDRSGTRRGCPVPVSSAGCRMDDGRRSP